MQLLKLNAFSKVTVLLVTLLITGSLTPLSAQTTHLARWNSFSDTDWNTAANWFPAVIPDNTFTDLYNIHIEGQPAATSNVVLSTGVVINELDIDFGDTLTLGPLASLSFTDKRDTGTIESSGVIFSEGRDSSIRGGEFLNHSLLEARPGSTFTLNRFDGPTTVDQSNGVSHTGILSAKGAGASLVIDVTEVFGGTIHAEDSGTVDLQNGLFQQVSFTSANGGQFDNLSTPNGNVTFNRISIASDTEVELGGSLDLMGEIDIDGTLHYDGTSRIDLLSVENRFTFKGSGQLTQKTNTNSSVVLSANALPNSSINIESPFTCNGSVAIGAYNSFINNMGTISYTGSQIGHLYPGGTSSQTSVDRYSVLTNSGLIEATVPGKPLRFHADRDDVSYNNSGTIRAHNQGLIEVSTGSQPEIAIYNGAFLTNAGQDGVIAVDGASSEIRLNNASFIIGGDIELSDSGTLTLNDTSSLSSLATSSPSGTGTIDVLGGTGTDAISFADVTNGLSVEVVVGIDRDLQIAPPDNLLSIPGNFTNNGTVRLRQSKLLVGDFADLNGTGSINLESNSRLSVHTEGDTFSISAPLQVHTTGHLCQVGDRKAVVENGGAISCDTGLLIAHPWEAGAGFTNTGSITSDGSSSEVWFRAGTFTNSGLVEAKNGGKVSLTTKASGLAGGKPFFVNRDGEIRADGQDSTVDVLETDIQNGSLTARDSATVTIEGVDVALNNVTINSQTNAVTLFEDFDPVSASVVNCDLNVSDGGKAFIRGCRIDNLTGLITQNDSLLQVSGGTIEDSTITLTNMGKLNIFAGSSLDDTIIRATDSTTTTELVEGLAMDCTLDTGAGGTINYHKTTLTDVDVTGSGTLLADNSLINGLIENLRITTDATFQLEAGYFFTGTNVFDIDGTITADGTQGVESGILIDTPLTLNGDGSYIMTGMNAFISGIVAGSDLTLGPDFTLQGGGAIGRANQTLDLINNGTIIINDPTASATFLLNSPLQNNGTVILDDNRSASFNTDFINHGSFEMNPSSSVAISGDLTNNGTATMGNSSNSTITGDLTNNGTATMGNSSSSTITGDLINTGTLTMDNASNSMISKAATNSGTVSLNAAAMLNLATTYTQSIGITTVNGTITAPQGILVNGGLLKGGGIINGNFSVNAATVAPGDSIGTLTSAGNATFSSATRLEFELHGTTAGSQYDQFQVGNGNLSLGNAGLFISLANTFIPSSADVFTIASSQLGISGTIGNLTEGRITTAGNKGTFAVSVLGTSLQLSDFQPTISEIQDLDNDLLGDDWERANFGDTESQGALDDPDKDGFVNLIEYALGTDPNASNPESFTIAVGDHNNAQHLFVTFQRRINLESILSIELESSETLAGFTSTLVPYELHATQSAGIDLESVTYRSTQPIGSLPAPVFTRLSITAP